MKIVFFFLVVFAAIVVLGMLTGLFFKRIVVVERSIIIDVSRAELYRILRDFNEFVKWSPWSDKDPEMKQQFEGTPGEPAHKYSWKGNRKVGEGSMTILAADLTRIEMELVFGKRAPSRCCWFLRDAAGGTEIRWVMESDMGKVPATRIFGPMMQKFVGIDFEQGLEKLKHYAEGQKNGNPVSGNDH